MRATRRLAAAGAALLFAAAVYLYATEDAEIGTIALAVGTAALLLVAIGPPADGWRARLRRVDAWLSSAGPPAGSAGERSGDDARSPDPRPDRASAPPS